MNATLVCRILQIGNKLIELSDVEDNDFFYENSIGSTLDTGTANEPRMFPKNIEFAIILLDVIKKKMVLTSKGLICFKKQSLIATQKFQLYR